MAMIISKREILFFSGHPVIIKYHTLKRNNPSAQDGYLFEFSLDSKGESYVLDKYVPDNVFDKPTEVVVPSTFLGLPVTIIGSQSFYAEDKLEKVTLPEGIVNIESSAFRNCRKLYNINIPSSLRFIKEYAFEGCDSLRKLEFSNTIWMSLRAFSQCTSLEELIITGSCNLDDYVFYECKNLKVANILGVYTIGSEAFKNCGIVTVTLSDSLTRLGANCFNGCKDLETMYIYGTAESFTPSTEPWWNYDTGDYEIIYL